MVFAEEIRKTILKLAEERGPEQSFGASDVARAMDEENSHQLLDQVKLVAGVLMDEGKITVIQSGGNSSYSFSKAPLNEKNSLQ